MFSVRSIIAENNKTFYEYNSNRPVSIRRRLVLTGLLSAVTGFYLDRDFKDFLNGVITVQAILIGFSFSVMFFLMSAAAARAGGQDNDAGKGKPLEDELRDEKLEKLSSEIFHNVAYFNLVAMACLAVALMILLPNNSDVAWNFLKYLKIETSAFVEKPYGVFLLVAQPAVRAVFLFLLFESAFTFARTTGRVNYLFAKNLEARAPAGGK